MKASKFNKRLLRLYDVKKRNLTNVIEHDGPQQINNCGPLNLRRGVWLQPLSTL